MTDNSVVTNGLLKSSEAAEWLKISLRTLANLDIRRVKIGKCVRYDVRDLQLYADLHGDRPPVRLEAAPTRAGTAKHRP